MSMLAGGILAGLGAWLASQETARAQDRATAAQNAYNQQALEEQRRTASQNEQETNRANALDINAGALLAASQSNPQSWGNLTGGTGVRGSTLNLGNQTTLGTAMTTGQKSALGTLQGGLMNDLF